MHEMSVKPARWRGLFTAVLRLGDGGRPNTVRGGQECPKRVQKRVQPLGARPTEGLIRAWNRVRRQRGGL